MDLKSRSAKFLFASLVALPLAGAAITSALAQQPAPAKAPEHDKGGEHEKGPKGERRAKPDDDDKNKEERSEWREKYKQELREHPRIARSMVALHETREHLEKAPHDFGGHKVAAIKAIDDALKELSEAIKFDATHESKGEDRREERREKIKEKLGDHPKPGPK